jgi:hypothetical protein
MTTNATTSSLDNDGVLMIYPTASNNHVWHVSMVSPTNDPYLLNVPSSAFVKASDGTWQVSGNQIRENIWSPPYQWWLNVEITQYSRLVSDGGDNYGYMFQIYRGGGQHSTSSVLAQGDGFAYKLAVMKDGTMRFRKEVAHPLYANRNISGQIFPIDYVSSGKWLGMKLIVYNIKDSTNGKICVKLEAWVDSGCTNISNGNLLITGNETRWRKVGETIDKGDWNYTDSDFLPNTWKPVDVNYSHQYRTSNEILNSHGGDYYIQQLKDGSPMGSHNIIAFRTDNIEWRFGEQSGREIIPPTTL